MASDKNKIVHFIIKQRKDVHQMVAWMVQVSLKPVYLSMDGEKRVSSTVVMFSTIKHAIFHQCYD